MSHNSVGFYLTSLTFRFCIKDKTTKGKNVEFDLPYYFSKLLQIANFDVS